MNERMSWKVVLLSDIREKIGDEDTRKAMASILAISQYTEIIRKILEEASQDISSKEQLEALLYAAREMMEDVAQCTENIKFEKYID